MKISLKSAYGVTAVGNPSLGTDATASVKLSRDDNNIEIDLRSLAIGLIKNSSPES